MEDQSLSIKFVADVMLGTLAKWLRIAGYDTLFDPSLDDHQLVRLARAEGRTLLTRDRELARRRGVNCLLVVSEKLDEQLGQILGDRRWVPDQSFSRCPVCNAALQTLDPEAARPLVPPYVARTQSRFSQCPSCLRVFWRGTHWERMVEHLARFRSPL
jgi:hypothetical protein